MNIGFDIDGVLTDLESFMLSAGQKYLNKPPVNRRGDDIAPMYDVPQEAEDAFWRDMILDYTINHPARPNAAKVIQKLQSEGHKIFVITNRCRDLSYCSISTEQMQNYIKDWFRRHHIEVDKFLFNTERSKLPICLEYKIDVMIDDDLQHIAELTPHIKTICFRADYNEDSDLSPLYVTTLDEIYERITKWK